MEQDLLSLIALLRNVLDPVDGYTDEQILSTLPATAAEELTERERRWSLACILLKQNITKIENELSPAALEWWKGISVQLTITEKQ